MKEASDSSGECFYNFIYVTVIKYPMKRNLKKKAPVWLTIEGCEKVKAELCTATVKSRKKWIHSSVFLVACFCSALPLHSYTVQDHLLREQCHPQ